MLHRSAAYRRNNAMADRPPGKPEQIKRAADLHRLIGLGRGREQRRQAQRSGEGVEDEPDICARLRRKALRPAAGERSRQKERHVRARRRRKQEAGEDIGGRQ